MNGLHQHPEPLKMFRPLLGWQCASADCLRSSPAIVCCDFDRLRLKSHPLSKSLHREVVDPSRYRIDEQVAVLAGLAACVEIETGEGEDNVDDAR